MKRLVMRYCLFFGLCLLSGWLLLQLYACGSAGMPADPAGQPALESGVQPYAGALPGGAAAKLPPLPDPEAVAVPRTSSYANVVYYDGNAIYESSDDCIFSGDSIVIPSGEDALGYALYAFNTGGYDPDKLEVGLNVSANGAAWVGVSDYVMNTWRFNGPYTAPATIDLNGFGYLSGVGQFSVIVMAFDGVAVTCDYLVLTYENGISADYSVSGRVLDEHDAPIGGATVTASPGFFEGVTDAQGYYYLYLDAVGDYTLTPSSLDDYQFTPDSMPVSVDGHEIGADFTGTRTDVIGRVATAEGAGVAGVTLQLNPGGMLAASGADGSFMFRNVAAGMYAVEPQLAGYTFEPVGRNVEVTSEDYTSCDFEATGGAPTYAIRGRIALADDTPVSNVTVVLSPSYRIAYTDASGNYAFFGVGNGSYSVEPHLGFYTFAPVSRSVVVADASAINQDFTATEPPPLYEVHGKVRDDEHANQGIPNIRVTIEPMSPGGPDPLTQYSDHNGDFSFMVPDGGYIVSASKLDYEFASPSVTVSGAGQTVDVAGHFVNGATWNSFVREYVSNYCIQCHRPDSGTAVDPYLRNYSEAKAAGSSSNFRVQNNTMPPGFTNLPLYQEYFQEWKDNGYPEE